MVVLLLTLCAAYQYWRAWNRRSPWSLGLGIVFTWVLLGPLL